MHLHEIRRTHTGLTSRSQTLLLSFEIKQVNEIVFDVRNVHVV
jgi:hypothetical protein